MEVDVVGIIAVAVFYCLILGVGFYAGRKIKEGDSNGILLANRDIGPIVGIFTLTATWVGGSLISGTAEAVYTQGVVWAQPGIAYAISLILAGLVFARRMRRAGYITMLDPLEEKYGKGMATLLFLPALFGELIWSASVLMSLGTTFREILGLNLELSIIVSAAFAIMYTLSGGALSVAYTDVIELILMFFGLILCIPFILTNKAVDLSRAGDWVGTVSTDKISPYTEGALLTIFGGIPWQSYFQRVLSARSEKQVAMVSCVSAILCVALIIPPAVVGIAARGTDWSATAYNRTVQGEDTAAVLPIMLHYLTPKPVSIIGLAAIAAAVMSSTDASMLSAASMFSHNIYRRLIRKKAGETEMKWFVRLGIVLVGSIATALSITVKSIIGMVYLCADFVYVILLPQLTTAVLLPPRFSSLPGSIVAYFIPLFLRISGGEPLLGLPALIKYPWYDEATGTQTFPYKTMSMLIGFILLVTISVIYNYFKKDPPIVKDSNPESFYSRTNPIFEFDNNLTEKDHL